MIEKKALQDIYDEYKIHSGDYFNRHNYFRQIPDKEQLYKEDILELLGEAINNKDVTLLQFCIGAAFTDGIDASYILPFKTIILERWHEEHEDIVQIVQFHLNNDVFTDALLEIALHPEIYRKFDDENESTLRKCVHALMAINSPKAKLAIERLIELNNPNVGYALENYE